MGRRVSPAKIFVQSTMAEACVETPVALARNPDRQTVLPTRPKDHEIQVSLH
jgi:hypothetical protein